MIEKVLSEEQSDNILKLLYALRVLHFPDIDDPSTHVEIKFVNSSGVDQIIHFGNIEKLRNVSQKIETMEDATENVEKALSSLLI
jgi:hypothetical protein